MESQDSYSGSETESELSFGAVDFDSIVQEAEARQVLGRESVRNMRKQQKTETKPWAMLPSNLHAMIMLMDKHISKALHGHDYDRNFSIRVVGAAVWMQKGHLQKVQQVGKEKAKYIKKPRIRDTICNLFHIGGHDAYSQIIGGYLANQKIYQSGSNKGGGRSGNRNAKESRIPQTMALQILVQDFVRSCCMSSTKRRSAKGGGTASALQSKAQTLMW
jgi:hypothetical protein